MRRINNQTMRENNVQIILDEVRRHGPVSRTTLAQELGLTSPAVTNIVAGLMQDGLLLESGRTDSAVGRKRVLLDINPSIRYLLGMVLTTEEVSVVLTDFSARIVRQEKRRISPLSGKDTILAAMIDCARNCIWQTGTPKEQILGIGIAAPGPMDTRRGVLLNPPNFPDWHDVPICSIMENALGLPAILDKETNAAALAEYYFGTDEEYRSMFFILLLSNAIGGSLMLNGEVFHGFEDGAGDIGHSLVDINGPLCACGQYGCLERVACGDALVNKAKARLKSMNNVKLPVPCDVENLTLEDVFRFSNMGVALFEEIVDYAAQMIATAIGNVVSILSPSLVVVSGSLTEEDPTLVSRIRTYVHSRSYPSCVQRIRIEASKLGDMGCARGAAMLAINAFQGSLCSQDTI